MIQRHTIRIMPDKDSTNSLKQWQMICEDPFAITVYILILFILFIKYEIIDSAMFDTYFYICIMVLVHSHLSPCICISNGHMIKMFYEFALRIFTYSSLMATLNSIINVQTSRNNYTQTIITSFRVIITAFWVYQLSGHTSFLGIHVSAF